MIKFLITWGVFALIIGGVAAAVYGLFQLLVYSLIAGVSVMALVISFFAACSAFSEEISAWLNDEGEDWE